VSRLCALFGVSRPGYYARLHRGVSRRTEQDRILLVQIRGLFDENKGRYGSPRIHQALKRAGVRVSRRRVERLMRAGDMRGRVARVYRSRPGLHKVYGRHKNLL
jgi:putative transposase